MMALVGIELEMLVPEPDALTTRPPPCDLPDFINAVKYMAARFQSYEYTLSEIFMTCGTQLNTQTSKYFYLALVNKPDPP